MLKTILLSGFLILSVNTYSYAQDVNALVKAQEIGQYEKQYY